MQPSHQTVRLAKGKHTSPQRGVCVMELASMLAGEPFTDHPRSVAPSIGALLRGYGRRLRDDDHENPQTSAVRAIHTIRRLSDETHAAVLALLDELVAIRSPRGPAARVQSDPAEAVMADPVS